ncbi:MAG: ABC transporter substrate-binding protein [Oscillospiraceae bacterium]|jgi:peptide/nickel transport system substrate-binding protein|nr:ABC transporter substrate-binding protein [Oscillospiraceae bacterium]
MTAKPFAKAACAVLALAVLTSCSVLAPAQSAPPGGSPAPDYGAVSATPRPSSPPEAAGGGFSLRYNPNASMNPISSTDPVNAQLSSLLFEGLFALNPDFTARPVLCESFETADGVKYDFRLLPDVAMTNGSTLDAYDAVYSIEQARKSARYSKRLAEITGVSRSGALEFSVTLKVPNYLFPALLDFAVVKYGYDGSVPPGTGPYWYDASGSSPKLTAFSRHRNADELQIPGFGLAVCSDSELGEYFTRQDITFFGADPNGSLATEIRRDHEARFYGTTNLQYVGFGLRTPVMLDARFRRAVALAVNREKIVSEYLGGHAKEAWTPFSPGSVWFDEAWVTKPTEDARILISRLLSDIGMEDSDADSWLEYPDASGFSAFALTMLVSGENNARVAAARSIADTLTMLGIDVALVELPFADFTQRLASGDFDLYYAETKIPADFDFSALLSPGEPLDFGGAATYELAELNAAFLGADSDFARRGAAAALAAAVRDSAPFVPVAYTEHALYSPRNLLRDAAPTPSGLYVQISGWRRADAVDT